MSDSRAEPFFDGKRVARKDFSGGMISVSYYFSDNLGTASVITNSTGTTTEDEDFYPWGGEVQFVNNDSNHYKYGAHERDGETGLDYMLARYYSNPLGRFLTPDWAAKPITVPYADFGNPQSLNLYSYTKNNPTTFGDPDGHCCDLSDVVDFVVGAANAIASDNLAGAGRFESGTTANSLGHIIGDGIAIIQGAGETVLGVGGEVGSTAADATGVGAIVGVPGNIASAAVIVHGVTTTATATSHLLGDSGNSGSKPYEATPENVDKMDKGKAPTGNDGNPVELHHPNGNPNAPAQEMTRTDHRLGPNYKQNHPNTNRQPSRINRTRADKERQQHWKDQAKKTKEQKSE